MNDSSPPPVPMIEALHLTRQYGSFLAVDDVSFSIPAGEVVAFLGPNGAGKSTTIKMLTGSVTPGSGQVRIGGHDVLKDRIAATRLIGYLPENGPLYEEMTPASLLRFFAKARGLGRGQIRERVEAVIDRCSLQQVTTRPISKLSKGYRQRVGLAQALLHDPEVLLLDEPTSGLDPNQRHEVRALLKELGQTKTILLSSHIMREVISVADRVLLIDRGRLVFDGPVSEFGEDEAALESRFRSLTDANGNGVAAVTTEAAS